MRSVGPKLAEDIVVLLEDQCFDHRSGPLLNVAPFLDLNNLLYEGVLLRLAFPLVRQPAKGVVLSECVVAGLVVVLLL